ncbi:MAG: FkbM family methyltransferase [Planctomycetota bacterium]|jgi:FkbM family methyltransferase
MRIEPLRPFCGNAPAQYLLLKAVRSLNRLRGIGTGGGPRTSGERVLPKLVRGLNRSPAVVFDVGANRGQFLDMMLERLAASDVMFHVFEPSGATFERLRQRHERTPNTTLNKLGLGASSGTMTLYLDSEGSELASLTRRNIGYLGHSMDMQERVEITTLDEYCAERSIERIDLLKLDVEGHELDVLHGAHGMLSAGRVSLVEFEFGGCNVDTHTNLKDYYDLLTEHSMRLHRLTPTGYLHPLERYRVYEEQYESSLYVATSSEPGRD